MEGSTFLPEAPAVSRYQLRAVAETASAPDGVDPVQEMVEVFLEALAGFPEVKSAVMRKVYEALDRTSGP